MVLFQLLLVLFNTVLIFTVTVSGTLSASQIQDQGIHVIQYNMGWVKYRNGVL